jgi:hypothetical protein
MLAPVVQRVPQVLKVLLEPMARTVRWELLGHRELQVPLARKVLLVLMAQLARLVIKAKPSR